MHIDGVVSVSACRSPPANASGWPGWPAPARARSVTPSLVLLAPSGGKILVAGEGAARRRCGRCARKGVGYVPRDRHARGIVPLLSIAENMTMTILDRMGRAGVMLPRRQDGRGRRMVGSLQIVAASTDQPIKELSGGNQQKAVMARALASEPQVLVLLYPTQGVDIASKEALFAIVERARAGGTAVLIVSRRAG